MQTGTGSKPGDAPELEDIEASARFFEDEDGLHPLVLLFEDADDHAGNSTVAFTIREAACSRYASTRLPAFPPLPYARRNRRWSTATPTNCCSTCSRPKSSSWRMKLKTSTATWKS